MKALIILTISFFSFCQISCKKNYRCLCSSDTVDARDFNIKDTKKNAKKTCKEYETNGKLSYVPNHCEISD